MAVSYTHLDVYKRQIKTWQESGGKENFMRDDKKKELITKSAEEFSKLNEDNKMFILGSVSYTHPNAFSYPKKMTMYGPSDCYAETYASGKGIKYVTQDIHATSVSLRCV